MLSYHPPNSTLLKIGTLYNEYDKLESNSQIIDIITRASLS